MGMFEEAYGNGVQPAAQAEPLAMPTAPGQTMFDEYMGSRGQLGQSNGGVNQVSDTSAGEAEPQWSDLPGNILPSAGANISAMAQTVRHPIDTAKNLYHAGLSGLKDYVVDRYGSYDNVKKTIIQDPTGFLLDLSTFLGGGGGAAAKLGGAAGKIGAGAAKASRMIDPMLGAGKLVSKAATGAGRLTSGVLGATTGAGDAVTLAAEAGLQGGSSAKALKANMAGKVTAEELVGRAQGALINAHKHLSSRYGTDLDLIKEAPVKPRPAFRGIATALRDAAKEYGGYKPKGTRLKPLENSVAPVITAMKDEITAFAAKDPRFFTIGGFDGLKRNLKVVRNKYEIGSEERGAANKIYNSVREAIIKVHPDYEGLTGQYGKDQKHLGEIQKTLSLGPNSTTDSALRKMLTIPRSYTTHANFGARKPLVESLVKSGAHDLMYELAGQTLRPNFKSTMVSQMLGAGAGLGYLGGVVGPWGAATLAAFSPKLIGHAAYTSGRIASVVVKPLIATERALKRVGISRRGMAMGATQAGKVSEYQKTMDQKVSTLNTALLQQAKAMGYNIAPSVLHRLASKLLSEDSPTYVRGLNKLGNSERLMSVIKALGEQKGNE